MESIYYIVVSGPRELLIAVETREERYEIYEVEYGRDLIYKIEESPLFYTIPVKDLPYDIANDFDFKRKHLNPDRVENIFIHKQKYKPHFELK